MSNRPKIEKISTNEKTKSGITFSYNNPTGRDLDLIQKVFSKNNDDEKNIEEQSKSFIEVFSIISLKIEINGGFYSWDADMSNELPFNDIVEIFTIIMDNSTGKKK